MLLAPLRHHARIQMNTLSLSARLSDDIPWKEHVEAGPA